MKKLLVPFCLTFICSCNRHNNKIGTAKIICDTLRSSIYDALGNEFMVKETIEFDSLETQP